MKKKLSGTRRLAMAGVLALVLLLPLAAQANLVENGSFDNPAKFSNTGMAFDVTIPTTHESWLAGTSWQRNTGNFAEKTGIGTDLLLQGFPLPTLPVCANATWKVKLAFKYKNPEDAPVSPGTVKMFGFGSGSGTWNSQTGIQTGGTSLLDAALNSNVDNWESYETYINPIPNYPFYAVGFNLPAVTSGTNYPAVDNVVVEIVAPVSLKFTPTTLNLKSQGNYVTVFISNLPSCFTKNDIVTGSIRLAYLDNPGIAPKSLNTQGKKIMMKFDRQELIDMLNNHTGNLPLVLTGSFDDDLTTFEGRTTVKVIKPGKGPK